MEEAGYYSTGPYLMHSSDKVLLNPYTQNEVLSNICSYNIMADNHGWMVTINDIQTQPNIDE